MMMSCSLGMKISNTMTVEDWNKSVDSKQPDFMELETPDDEL